MVQAFIPLQAYMMAARNHGSGLPNSWISMPEICACRNIPSRVGEESVPTYNRIGAVISSRLLWEIKCQDTGKEPPR